MSDHTNVYGYCENKCKVPVYSEEQVNKLVNGDETATAITDSDLFAFTEESTEGHIGSIFKRKASIVWNWIKSKIDLIYKGMTTETLLWENASPTSNFASQNLIFDLTDIDEITIEFKNHKTGSLTYRQTVSVGKSIDESIAERADTADTWFVSRQFNATTSLIHFSNAYVKSVISTTKGGMNNEYMIPERIIARKRV